MTQRETARNPVPRPCRPGCLPAAELAENRADGGAAHDPARNAPAPEAFGDVPEERRPQPGSERLAVEADLRDEFIAVKVEPGRIDRNFEDSGLNHLPAKPERPRPSPRSGSGVPAELSTGNLRGKSRSRSATASSTDETASLLRSNRMPETEPPSTSGASGEGAASEAISRHGRCARTSASSSGCSSYSSAG